MAYRVRIESFEGPFDLLLHLVSRQRVDIGSISITQIADQYLSEVARMQKVDLEVASDFLLVAATLLEIKASSVLAQDDHLEDEEIEELTPEEARMSLISKLIAYKQYKNAAYDLSVRERAEMRMHARTVGPEQDLLHVIPDYLQGISLHDLAYLCVHVASRRDVVLLESEHIAAKPIPVEVYVHSIWNQVHKQKKLALSDLIADDTPDPIVVVTFLAVLELYKRGMVHAYQHEPFGDIEMEYIEGSGELLFMGDRKE